MSTLLFVTWAGGGNVPPVVVMARALADRGHTVRVMADASLAARFAAAGVDHVVLSQPYSLPAAAAEVGAELERVPTDVAVVDYMLPTALSAAQAAGVPSVAYVHTLYDGMAAAEMTPMAMLGDIAAVNEVRAILGLDPSPDFASLLHVATRVMVVTVAELDAPAREVPPNVEYVGPLVEAAGDDAGWTPPGRPLVVVSMGTTAMDEAPVIGRVLDGVAGLDAYVVVTLGEHLDPAGFSPPANTLLTGYLRHAAVLPHADLVVTHGGLGTISAALAHGVPLVCLPLGRDQPVNAATVVAAGAGRSLPPDASSAELAAAITAVLGDDRYGAAARRLAAVIDGYVRKDGAVRLLEGIS